METTTISKKKTNVAFLFLIFLLLFGNGLMSRPCYGEVGDEVAAARQIGKAFTVVAGQASAAVVGIKSERLVSRGGSGRLESPFGDQFFDDEFFDQFFRRHRSPRGEQPKSRQLAQGSGFIISEEGYILTNNHVIADSEKITVILSDEREFEAELIGTDPDSEVAVIKIDANDLPVLELGDSDELEVGEWVLAIGNPFGLSHTVTAGIVSAKSRSGVGLATYEDFIQTDAAINPGNSGGPLLNLNGEVVGINTAIVSQSGGNMGIGFAIPINMARSVYEQIVDGGTVVRGFLGVNIQDLDPKLAKYFGLEDAKGVLIPEIMEDSAAGKAGLKAGDVIVELNGEPVEKARDLQNRIAMFKPGTKVDVLVIRDGEKKKYEVELGERPGAEVAAGGKSKGMKKLGVTLKNLTDEIAEQLGYVGEKGVVVTDVEQGSLAAEAGIRPGTLIVEVDRKRIEDVKDFEKALEKAEEAGKMLLRVRYKNSTRYVGIDLGDD
ncbi:MAG: DegQ family serine endoprotease [Phycisphaerae bacterium]|nr:DegQ family serine endoprotease [Phycisphaerae bacterium]